MTHEFFYGGKVYAGEHEACGKRVPKVFQNLIIVKFSR